MRLRARVCSLNISSVWFAGNQPVSPSISCMPSYQPNKNTENIAMYLSFHFIHFIHFNQQSMFINLLAHKTLS